MIPVKNAASAFLEAHPAIGPDFLTYALPHHTSAGYLYEGEFYAFEEALQAKWETYKAGWAAHETKPKPFPWEIAALWFSIGLLTMSALLKAMP